MYAPRDALPQLARHGLWQVLAFYATPTPKRKKGTAVSITMCGGQCTYYFVVQLLASLSSPLCTAVSITKVFSQ